MTTSVYDIAFGYVATTRGSTAVTLISEFGPLSTSGVPLPVFSDGTPGVSTLTAHYPPSWPPPADWSSGGVMTVFQYAHQSFSEMTLSADLSTSGPITSLPIDALGPYDYVLAWTTVTVSDPASGNSQNFIVNADVAPYATSLPIVAATPNFAYPSGANIGQATNYYTISGTAITTTCAAVLTCTKAWAAAIIRPF